MSFNPLTTHAELDHVVLAGHKTPGIAEILDAASPRRWDERRRNGASGATLVFRGVSSARFRIMLRLSKPEHFAEWDAFAPLVQRPPDGETARALQIEHPIPNDLGIRSVVIENVKQPTPIGESGEWGIEIAVIEYREPQRALARPRGAALNGEQSGEVTEATTMINGLMSTLQELAQ